MIVLGWNLPDSPKQGTTMRIRQARENDAAAMAGLSGQLGYASTRTQILARMRALAARSDHEVLVVEENDAVLGWVHVFGAQRIESDAFAEIAGLVVAEGRRSRGLGAALLAAAEVWACERGYRTLRVRSNIVREGARRFYERNGYVCTKQSFVFTKSLAGTSVSRPGPDDRVFR